MYLQSVRSALNTFEHMQKNCNLISARVYQVICTDLSMKHAPCLGSTEHIDKYFTLRINVAISMEIALQYVNVEVMGLCMCIFNVASVHSTLNIFW